MSRNLTYLGLELLYFDPDSEKDTLIGLLKAQGSRLRTLNLARNKVTKELLSAIA